MGIVGWSVTLPLLAGIFLGRWIDRTWPSKYSFTLMLLFAGLAAGCWNAWYWVKRAGRIRKEDLEKKIGGEKKK